MIPQCGYYSNNQNGQRGASTYGGRVSQHQMGSGRNNGVRSSPSNCGQMSGAGMQSRSYGGSYGNGGSMSRGPPVFQQQNRSSYRAPQQQAGGYPNTMPNPLNRNCSFQPQQPQACPIPYTRNNIRMGYQEPQMVANQKHLAPVPYCTPQAIKVNVTAEQLQNARSTPFQDRGEPSLEGAEGVKYIQLNWKDLLGGMDKLRVTMGPNQDPCNPNQQLRVSFGGQKFDPPQAGETNLKVLSIEPANTGRMDIDQGNALAGSMKICNSPVTNLCPANQAPSCPAGGPPRFSRQCR